MSKFSVTSRQEQVPFVLEKMLNWIFIVQVAIAVTPIGHIIMILKQRFLAPTS